MPWQVVLDETPAVGKLLHNSAVGWDFRDNYFPRRFHYKKDAEALRQEVERKGGRATVLPAPKRP